jgi:hypothetical protein
MSAVEEQNLAVQALKNEADEREKAHSTAIANARAKSDTFKKQADALLKRAVPQNTTVCDAANQLINEELKK